tara:strand:+ start:572 stop:811 length:240 start_codon:yes stop_codon:yes gene_type:complete
VLLAKLGQHILHHHSQIMAWVPVPLATGKPIVDRVQAGFGDYMAERTNLIRVAKSAIETMTPSHVGHYLLIQQLSRVDS